MKNMNQRTKIILAIVGVVVVVGIVVGVVMNQAPTSNLSGAASDRLTITSSKSLPLLVDGTTDLTVDAVYKCTWSSSDATKVVLVNYTAETKTVTVKAVGVGSSIIEAKCGIGSSNINSVTLTVNVKNPTITQSKSSSSIIVGESQTLTSNASNPCTWSSSNNGITFVGATTGSSATIKGAAESSSTTITAQCGNSGLASIALSVGPFAFSTNPQSMTVENEKEISTPLGESCTWTTAKFGSSYPVQFKTGTSYSYSPQTGTSVRLYAASGGTGTITVSCPEGRTATLTVNVKSASAPIDLGR